MALQDDRNRPAPRPRYERRALTTLYCCRFAVSEKHAAGRKRSPARRTLLLRPCPNGRSPDCCERYPAGQASASGGRGAPVSRGRENAAAMACHCRTLRDSQGTNYHRHHQHHPQQQQIRTESKLPEHARNPLWRLKLTWGLQHSAEAFVSGSTGGGARIPPSPTARPPSALLLPSWGVSEPVLAVETVAWVSTPFPFLVLATSGPGWDEEKYEAEDGMHVFSK